MRAGPGRASRSKDCLKESLLEAAAAAFGMLSVQGCSTIYFSGNGVADLGICISGDTATLVKTGRKFLFGGWGWGWAWVTFSLNIWGALYYTVQMCAPPLQPALECILTDRAEPPPSSCGVQAGPVWSLKFTITAVVKVVFEGVYYCILVNKIWTFQTYLKH